MLFWLPPICAVILGVIFLFVTEASSGAKLVVAALIIGSFALKFFFPTLWLAALIVQVIVSIGILLYLKVTH